MWRQCGGFVWCHAGSEFPPGWLRRTSNRRSARMGGQFRGRDVAEGALLFGEGVAALSLDEQEQPGARRAAPNRDREQRARLQSAEQVSRGGTVHGRGVRLVILVRAAERQQPPEWMLLRLSQRPNRRVTRR